MNKAESFIKGANAFYRGDGRSPITDPSFHPFTNPFAHKNMDVDNIKAWLNGWDSANLSEEQSDIAEHDAAAKAEALNEQILFVGRWRMNSETEREEAYERWVEDLKYKQSVKEKKAMEPPSETFQAIIDELEKRFERQDGVRFNPDGSVSLSADWIMKNAEKD